MKKLFILTALSSLALASCRTKCPAYSATKPATHTATPTFTAADAAPHAPARQ